MKKSQDSEVQKFLDELKTFDAEKFKMVSEARSIVIKQVPKVGERIMYGGIMFTDREDFGGLFVSKNHVSFEFSQGVAFKDPEKHLEGSGKFRRHLKFLKPEDVIKKQTAHFVAEAIKRQGWPHSLVVFPVDKIRTRVD